MLQHFPKNFITNASDPNNETYTVSKAVVQNRRQTLGRKIRRKYKKKLGIHKAPHD